MPVFLFKLRLHFYNSCVGVSTHVYTFPSPSISMPIYRHTHMYICFDYSVMTLYNSYVPLTQRLCVPAHSGVIRCLHTCDPMFQSLYYFKDPWLRFLWIHIYHVHIKNAKFCVYLPPHICALPQHVFVRILSIHLKTCSCVDVQTMRGNKIGMPCIHNEMYQETNTNKLIDWIISCTHSINHKI